jgi:hypothetical protein
MNAKILLIASLVANAALGYGLMVLSEEFSRLPDSTPAALVCTTQAHPTAVEAPAATVPPSTP